MPYIPSLMKPYLASESFFAEKKKKITYARALKSLFHALENDNAPSLMSVISSAGNTLEYCSVNE